MSVLAVYVSQLSEIFHGFELSPGEAGEKWEQEVQSVHLKVSSKTLVTKAQYHPGLCIDSFRW